MDEEIGPQKINLFGRACNLCNGSAILIPRREREPEAGQRSLE